MRTLITIFSLLLFYSVCTGQSNCTQYHYGESVNTLEEDSIFLWIGSKENGLIRYNKLTHVKTIYDTLTSNISGNWISDLHYYNNELIITTDSNLLKFDNGNFSIINDTITGLLISDTLGNLIVAGNKGPVNWLYYFNDTTLIQQTLVDGLGFTNTDITIDSNGSLWIIRDEFYNSDVIKIDSNSQEMYNNGNTVFSTNNPYATSITSLGNIIWASFNVGVYSYNGTTWQLEHQTLLPDGTINSGLDTMKQFINTMEFDNSGILWCGTQPTSVQGTEIELLYKSNGNWNFIPQIDTQNTIVTDIYPSKYTDNIYCGTTEGFIIIDKLCLGIVNNIEMESNLIQLNVFPNPAEESINVTVANSNIKNITLLNMEGRTIRTYTNPTDKISIINIPNGTYILNISSDKGIITKKIIIK